LNEPFLPKIAAQKNFIFLQKSVDTSRLIATFSANPHGVGLQALSWVSTKPYIASSELSPGGVAGFFNLIPPDSFFLIV
jgi:hypothetical protein